MKTLLLRFADDERGATAIEYGLVAALIAVAIIVSMTVAGNSLFGLFGAITNRSTAAFDRPI